MFIKFPQISGVSKDKTFISFRDTAFAKHNIITRSSGKQIGFLAEHSLIFVLQGKKNFHFDKKTVSIKANQIMLISRGIYTISEFIPDNGCFEALIIFIPDKFLQNLYKQNNLTRSNSKKGYTVLNCNNLLKQFCSQYSNYFIGDFQGKEQLLKLKLEELFLLLQNSSGKAEINDVIASIFNKEHVDIEYIIRENLFLPLNIDDYAKLCMKSLASFKRDFKKQFNSSPKQWINQQRISHAVSLLHSTNRTVSEIAFECGFENTSHFIKLFKSHTGSTPSSNRAKTVIK